MPVPLFVLGKHRSGTTWLANQLCEHPAIAGVQHERHFGIHESAYFTHLHGRCGDLRNPANLDRFLDLLGRSEYFRLAGADLTELRRESPETYESLFRVVMDRFARDRDASYWLEKSPGHTPLVRWIARLYTDARFIAVERDIVEVVTSTLALAIRRDPALGSNMRLRRSEIVRTALSCGYFRKMLEEFAGAGGNILILRYDDLRADLPACMDNVCDFLSLPYYPELSRSRFVANSSFSSDTSSRGILTRAEGSLARRVAAGASKLPERVLRSAFHARRRVVRRPPLPTWFFPPEPSQTRETLSLG